MRKKRRRRRRRRRRKQPAGLPPQLTFSLNVRGPAWYGRLLEGGVVNGGETRLTASQHQNQKALERGHVREQNNRVSCYVEICPMRMKES